MAASFELDWDAQQFRNTWQGLSREVPVLVFDVEDEEEAETFLVNNVTATYAGARLDEIRITERRAENIWFGMVTYVSSAEEDGYRYSFSTTGGTARITQSLATVGAYAVSGTAPNFGGAIGVSKDKVEGCDIVVPVFTWKETHRILNASLTDSAKIALANLTGTVNSDSFRGFSPGEVRFDGVDGSRIDATYSAVDFVFSASPNATGLVVGAMSGIEKKGWEYLWVLYEETTSQNRLVKIPVACYVEQVYRYTAFSGLGL
jgi:hypothetical protein